MSKLPAGFLAISALMLVAARAGAAVDGAPLYVAKCALCHGKDGVPSPAMTAQKVPNLTDPQWQASRSDADLKKAVEDGKPGTLMRGFKADLSAEQIAALVAHLRSLKAAGK